MFPMDNNAIVQRILQLRTKDGLGYKSIAKILAKEYPDHPITLAGWRSRVERCILKHNLSNTQTTNKKVKVSNVTQPTATTPRSVERKSDGSYIYESIIELFEDEEVTPDRIMEAHKLSPTDWEVVSYKNNYWSQQTKAGRTVVLYQSKLIVRPRKFDNISEAVVLEHFINKSKEHIPVRQKLIHNNTLFKLFSQPM